MWKSGCFPKYTIWHYSCIKIHICNKHTHTLDPVYSCNLNSFRYSLTNKAHYRSYNCTDVMLLAGSWLLWGLPIFLKCPVWLAFAHALELSTPPVIFLVIRPPSLLRWLVSLLTSVLASTTHKAGRDITIFLTFWNSVKFNFHNKLLLEHSYPSLICLQRLILHFRGRNE